jgi:hypothetical protein
MQHAAWVQQVLQDLHHLWTGWEACQQASDRLLHSLANVEAQQQATLVWRDVGLVGEGEEEEEEEPVLTLEEEEEEGGMEQENKRGRNPLPMPPVHLLHLPPSLQHLLALHPHLLEELSVKQSQEINRILGQWRALLPDFQALVQRLQDLRRATLPRVQGTLGRSGQEGVRSRVGSSPEHQLTAAWDISPVEVGTWLDSMASVYAREWAARQALLHHLDAHALEAAGARQGASPTWKGLWERWSRQKGLDFQLESEIRDRFRLWKAGQAVAVAGGGGGGGGG